MNARTRTLNDAANVDPTEVAHYEQLAGTWWDQDGSFWPLHRLNCAAYGLPTAGLRVNPINQHFALTRVMAVNCMLVARRAGSLRHNRVAVSATAAEVEPGAY